MSREKVEIQCKDVVEGVAGAILEQIPVINFFVSAVGKVKEGTLQRRFESWQKMVGERLATLEDVVFDTLGDNETFATTFVKASELAAQSNAKKMEYLANAVRNSATMNIKDDYLIIFMKSISQYTLSHLKLLQFFREPSKYSDYSLQAICPSMSVFYKVCPEFESSLARKIVSDLYSDALFETADFDNLITDSYWQQSRTTNLGNIFLDFFEINEL